MFRELLALFGKQKPSNIKQPAPSRRPIPKARTVEAAKIGELGEHKINIQLDQLPKFCRTLSDIMIVNRKSRSGYSQIDHIVVAPEGIFVIEAKNYSGKIRGNKQDPTWNVNYRFKMNNPIRQNFGHIKALESVLEESTALPQSGLRNAPPPRYISIISFTMRCRFSVDPALRKIDSDELVIYDVELTGFITRKMNRIRATSNSPSLAPEQADAICEAIRMRNITDPAIREHHRREAGGKK